MSNKVIVACNVRVKAKFLVKWIFDRQRLEILKKSILVIHEHRTKGLE